MRISPMTPDRWRQIEEIFAIVFVEENVAAFAHVYQKNRAAQALTFAFVRRTILKMFMAAPFVIRHVNARER